MQIREYNPAFEGKSVDRADLRFCFKAREKDANKGDFGSVLCICGSFPENRESGSAMSGAATLSATAAYRTGSGLVKVFTHKENYAPISANLPEAVMIIYDKFEEELLKKELACASAVLVGCGLGQSETSKKILECVLQNIRCACVPLVIDADGLNILSQNPEWWDYLSDEQKRRTVITPHPKEMSRLCGLSVGDILSDTIGTAKQFSQKTGVITLLKGHRTVITDGRAVYVNMSGTPAMAKAGAGDVLSGILVSMLGNKTLYAKTHLKKTALAAFLHGRAGEFAQEKTGEHSLLASDIVSNIPEALGDAGVCDVGTF